MPSTCGLCPPKQPDAPVCFPSRMSSVRIRSPAPSDPVCASSRVSCCLRANRNVQQPARLRRSETLRSSGTPVLSSAARPQGRIPSGGVAQLGERYNRTVEVRGSNPLASTRYQRPEPSPVFEQARFGPFVLSGDISRLRDHCVPLRCISANLYVHWRRCGGSTT